VQPIFAAIELIAAHCEACSRPCSNTIRTARPHLRRKLARRLASPWLHPLKSWSLRQTRGGSGHDPGVCGHNFSCLSRLFLGFPDEARANGYKALELGEEINHPLSLLTAKLWLTRALLVRGDEADVLEAEGHLDGAIQLAADTGISRARWANFLAGWILSARGNPEEGRKRILQDFESLAGAGQDVFRAFDTGVLADVCRVAGRFDEGRSTIDKALVVAVEHDALWCLADLHRVQGELMRVQGEPVGAVENCFNSALAIAREQNARTWELRATISLAKLRSSKGRFEETQELLAPIYGWFSEGFDTADLKEARALLDEVDRHRAP
jgi:hypothetical protein